MRGRLPKGTPSKNILLIPHLRNNRRRRIVVAADLEHLRGRLKKKGAFSARVVLVDHKIAVLHVGGGKRVVDYLGGVSVELALLELVGERRDGNGTLYLDLGNCLAGTVTEDL